MSQSNEAKEFSIVDVATDKKVLDNNNNIIKFQQTNTQLSVTKQRKEKKFYKFMKRTFDFIIALLMLIVLSPIFLVISVAIKIDSKGSVLFKQVRTGKNGKEFMLYKFRSMVVENDVHDFSSQDKHTKVGNFIRKTSLDELPQLLNILKGDMSFIGPRPWIPDYFHNMNDEQKHRYDVLPGVTGLAQAMGRNNLTIVEKINYDLEYVNNCSIKEDVKVIFKTIETVLSKKGADAGKATIQNELKYLNAQNSTADDEDNTINYYT